MANFSARRWLASQPFGKVIKEKLLEKGNAGLSMYDRVKHLIGEIDGPDDLSTNPKYLPGFGQDLHSFPTE